MTPNEEFKLTCEFSNIDPDKIIDDFKSSLVAFVRDGSKNRVDAHMTRLFHTSPFVQSDDLRAIDD